MAAKTDSKFYIGQKLSCLRDDLQKQVETGISKYIKPGMKVSRRFIDDLKNDPKDTVNHMISDRKKEFKKFTADKKKSYDNFLKDSRNNVREIADGIKSDVKLAKKDLSDLKNKAFSKAAVKKDIKKRIDNVMISIPSRLNLPSRNEVDGIMKDLEGISKKVDQLNRLYA